MVKCLGAICPGGLLAKARSAQPGRAEHQLGQGSTRLGKAALLDQSTDTKPAIFPILKK